jgi:hypothetical protein
MRRRTGDPAASAGTRAQAVLQSWRPLPAPAAAGIEQSGRGRVLNTLNSTNATKSQRARERARTHAHARAYTRVHTRTHVRIQKAAGTGLSLHLFYVAVQWVFERECVRALRVAGTNCSCSLCSLYST